MDIRFFMARPVISGFELTTFFGSPNGESVKIYMNNIFKDVPVAIIEISQDDFNMFARSGFKFYTIPDLTTNVKQEPTNQGEVDETLLNTDDVEIVE